MEGEASDGIMIIDELTVLAVESVTGVPVSVRRGAVLMRLDELRWNDDDDLC